VEAASPSRDAGRDAGHDAFHAPVFNPIRIACGQTSAVMDADGNTWSPDVDFQGGQPALSPGQPVTGTSTPALYDGQRYGISASTFSYSIPVAPGAYTVVLKFTEGFVTAPGARLFNVSINGQLVLANFDIFAEGGDKDWVAVDRSFPVTATGPIAIEFDPNPSANNPKVDAIAILPPTAGDAGADAMGDSGPGAGAQVGLKVAGNPLTE
jgi:hypothetical protein